MKFKVGDRVAFIKSGYGPSAGKRVTGTVRSGSYGARNHILIETDDGEQDFGFAEYFKSLKKIYC